MKERDSKSTGFDQLSGQILAKTTKVAQPLRVLTVVNVQFIWSEQHDKAFDEVKKLVANYPVLKYYDIKTRLVFSVMPPNTVCS